MPRAPRFLIVVLVAACSPQVNIDVSGLQPLDAVGPPALAPRGRGLVKATGGTPPYRFAFEPAPPPSGADAEIDPESGEFRVGSIGRTTDTLRVTDSRGESRAVAIVIGEGLAVDPTRVVVDPSGLADFDAVGGQPPYAFRVEGLSADRVDPASGLFEAAGGEGGRTDTVVVTDANGAAARAEVQVTLNAVVGSDNLDVALLDFNRDGLIDAAVADSNGAAVALLRGDGRGNLSQVYSYPLGAVPAALKAVDLNADGLDDLLVAVRSPDLLVVLVQDVSVSGGFREAARQAIAAAPADVEVVPLTDGTVAVVTTSGTGKALDCTRLTAAGATVAVASTYRIALPDRGTRLAVGDFIGDGNLDVAVAVRYASHGAVLYFNGDGLGGFPLAPAVEIDVGGSGGVMLSAGQLGGGPKDDVVFAISLTSEMGLILDDAVGVPTLSRRPIPPGEGAQCQPCGRPEDAPCVAGAACVNLWGTAETNVCALTCQSSRDCPNDTDCQSKPEGSSCAPLLTCPVTSLYAAALNPRGIRVVDLDGDGTSEIVVSGIDGVDVFSRQGEPDFVAIQRVVTSPGCREIGVGDLNGDGLLDLVTGTEYGVVNVLLGRGRLFSRTGEHVVGGAPLYTAIADLDGDAAGVRDVLVGMNHNLLALLGDGRGGLIPFQQILFLNERDPVLTDIDGDGRLDLVACDWSARTVKFMPWREARGFVPGSESSAGLQPLSQAAADIDGDGVKDLVVANNLGSTFGIQWGQADHTFAPFTPDLVMLRYDDPTVFPIAVRAQHRADGQLDHFIALGQGTGRTLIDAVRVAADGTPTTTWSVDGPGTVPYRRMPRLFDCDSDGVGDFVLAYTGVANNAFDGQVWRGRADGTYELAFEIHTGTPITGSPGSYTATGPVDWAVGELTGDAHPDLLVSASFTKELVVFAGRGDCTFTEVGRMATGQPLAGLSTGDLDGDGLDDLAAVLQPNLLVTYQNLGTQSGRLREVTPAKRLCQQCASDEECGTAADRCVDQLGLRRLCARDCTGGKACPSGFVCTDLGEGVEQCLHEGEQCVY